MEAKRLLRSRLIAARALRSREERAAAGDALARHATARWRAARRVTAYAGVGTEPPTRGLLDGLRAAGVEVLLPVVVGPDLDWAVYDEWDALVPAGYGLCEPDGPRLGARALATADVVVVPALAVDGEGHRLGRGAAYYDRALAGVDPVRVVAVVYDDEVLAEVPSEPHDRVVGAVLTPSGLTRLGSR